MLGWAAPVALRRATMEAVRARHWVWSVIVVLAGCDGAEATTPGPADAATQAKAPAAKAAPPTATPKAEPSEPAASPKDTAAEADAAAALRVVEGDSKGPESCDPVLIGGGAGHPDVVSFESDDGKYGFKNAAGEVIVEPRFMMAFGFSDKGLGAVADEDGFAFIDTRGTVLARAFAFDNGPDYFVAGRARIIEGDKVGFIDETGTIVVEPTYEAAGSFCSGLAPVCSGCRREDDGEHYRMVGGRWGFIDRSGAVVVPLEHDEARHDGPQATVVDGGRVTKVQRDGAPVKEPAGAASP